MKTDLEIDALSPQTQCSKQRRHSVLRLLKTLNWRCYDVYYKFCPSFGQPMYCSLKHIE